jgi:hypothetical protein
MGIVKEAKDYGTKEIANRFNVVPKFTKSGTHMAVVDETEIDRLLLHDRITSADHAVLGALMARMKKANFVGIKSPSYDAPLSMDPSAVGDRRANQIRSLVKLFSALDHRLGKGKRTALVNLVLLDTPWPADDKSLIEAIHVLASLL